MLTFTKRLLYSLFLLFLITLPTVSQVQSIPFTWLDEQNQTLNGSLELSVVYEETPSIFKLRFVPFWYDENGELITEDEKRPILFLSKYSTDIQPDSVFNCVTFEASRSVYFEESGNLIISSALTGQFDLFLDIVVYYGFSKEQIDNGKGVAIKLTTGTDLKKSFHIELLAPQIADPDLSNYRINTPTIDPQKLYREEFERQLKSLEIRMQSLEGTSSGTTISNLLTRYPVNDELNKLEGSQRDSVSLAIETGLTSAGIIIGDLDKFSGDAELLKTNLIEDSLGSDHYSGFFDRLNDVIERTSEIRDRFDRYRGLLLTANLRMTDDPSEGIVDSLRLVCRNRFLPEFQSQLDSLQSIVMAFESNDQQLVELLDGPRAKARRNTSLDTLVENHKQFGFLTAELRKDHEKQWLNYNDFILSIGTIEEIEGYHNNFNEHYSNLSDTITQRDQDIAQFLNQLGQPGWIRSNLLLIILVAVIILIIIALLIIRGLFRDGRRNDYASAMASVGLDPATGGLVTGTLASTPGTMAPYAYEEYFSIDYSDSQSDTVVDYIHIHFSVIKSIYQLIQGALVQKNPTDFGGFLLGSQYKTNKSGSPRYELLIDQLAVSNQLRENTGTSDDYDNDLLDEMEKVVESNKKHLLLGWYTCSPNPTLEMPDGLAKFHKTYINEKWQIALLVNPGSKDLQSAFFLRRKTGFFELFPDPNFMIKWDDLYSYALNPKPTSSTNENDEIDYKKLTPLKLNSAWCDSIVENIFFDATLIDEIHQITMQKALVKKSYAVVGYLYGDVMGKPQEAEQPDSYDIVAKRFIEVQNSTHPRQIPGLTLLGCLQQGEGDMQEFLPSGLEHHEKVLKGFHQLTCLVNTTTGEMRFFTYKHNRELNNSFIDSEEFNLNELTESAASD